MYVNAKMIPVETVPGIREGRMKDRSRGGEFKYDIFDNIVRTFINANNVPPPSTTTTNEGQERKINLFQG
jgi:hypothetical protein